MTISTSTNSLNQIYSSLSKKNANSPTRETFKVYEENELKNTAFTQKVEGDYATYSAKELSELSYDEVKENYDEIQRILDMRMLEAKQQFNSESFQNHQKKLLASKDFEIRAGSIDQLKYMDNSFSFLNKDKITDEMLDKKFGVTTPENTELMDLLNFNDKFKIVNYFENDEINRAIYSKYEDNSQIYYEETLPTDFNDEDGFFQGMANSIQGTDLKQIVQSVKDAIEFIEVNGVIKGDGEGFSNGFYISGEEITIAGKRFSLYDVKKSDMDASTNKSSANKETNEVNQPAEVKDEKTDYNNYSIAQLRHLAFDEIKENYEVLKQITEDSLENISELSKNEVDNLLAFKAQLETVTFLKDETINEAIYNKIQSINDPKVAIWSALAIKENLESLDNKEMDAIVINGLLLNANDIEINEKKSDTTETNSLSKRQASSLKVLNLDSIIHTIETATRKGNTQSSDTYSKHLIKTYSDFMAEYQHMKNALMHSF
ncbi:hypothetical protein [Candidatus Marinarcus aquaticus]|uniref:Uncharacterized protein n=1 Tax=Candidatus Marinarcus aquaticus TaxID=2044504 RepID=A0A4Q0XQV7_9BACT|nr:hypothetical protein [Candidatus Marinarcus aquaticus]RXJ58072.1 hypothetical protein CRV04_06070 [Candidatus Marinarcus aquaticus]